jgi:cholestenol delta-isomerase
MFDHYYKGVAYSRPEFLYFWVYYFGMNFFWSVIPSCLINQSVQRIRKGMEVLARVEGGKKTQ